MSDVFPTLWSPRSTILLRFSGGDEKSGVAGVAELDIAWRESLSCGHCRPGGAPAAVQSHVGSFDDPSRSVQPTRDTYTDVKVSVVSRNPSLCVQKKVGQFVGVSITPRV